MRRPLRSLLLVATAVASFAVPASADWLILRGGKRIETKGPWIEHANNTVSFTETDGHRSSVLMSLIDNAATRQANGGKGPKTAAKGAKTESAATKTVISDDNTASIRLAEKHCFKQFATASRYGLGRRVFERVL